MIAKIIAYLGPVVFLVVLISGCTTTLYGDQAISLEELEGMWEGYGDSQLATSRVTCTIRVPITFSVKDGRAVSLCKDPRCTFDVPVKDNGTLRFKYKKALRSSGDYPGTQYLDISFEGQLSAGEGQGTFSSGGCVGKWKVDKVTNITSEYAISAEDVSTIREAAEKGNASAQYRLGNVYKKGLGVRQDYKEAVFWFKKAAIQGHSWAQNDLGSAYFRGQGVKQHFPTAFAWFKLSADQNNTDAQVNLKLFTDKQVTLGNRQYQELKRKYKL